MGMRKLLLILFLLPVFASAQSPMFKLIGNNGCRLILDTYTSASAAYSLRKLDGDYTGSAIRVRRSSDNTEQDIGFIGTCGDLDTTSMKTFVGANNGFVVTWYDQSGNNRDVTQATTTAQPRIINSGTVERLNNKVTTYFDGGDNLGTVDDGLPTGVATYVTVTYNTQATLALNQYRIIINYGQASTGSAVFLAYGDDAAFGGDAIGVSQYGDALGRINRLQLQNLQFVTKPSTTGTWYQYINNSLSSSKSMTTNTALSGVASSFRIGMNNAPAGGTSYLVGYIQEIIMWGTDFTPNREDIETNVNRYYLIY